MINFYGLMLMLQGMIHYPLAGDNNVPEKFECCRFVMFVNVCALCIAAR